MSSWCGRTPAGQPAQAELPQLLTARPAVKLVVAAGPGWDGTRVPDGVLRPATLEEAVTAIAGTER